MDASWLALGANLSLLSWTKLHHPAVIAPLPGPKSVPGRRLHRPKTDALLGIVCHGSRHLLAPPTPPPSSTVSAGQPRRHSLSTITSPSHPFLLLSSYPIFIRSCSYIPASSKQCLSRRSLSFFVFQGCHLDPRMQHRALGQSQ